MRDVTVVLFGLLGALLLVVGLTMLVFGVCEQVFPA